MDWIDLALYRDRWRALGRLILILRWVFRKWDEGVWTGLIWLCIGTGGGHL